MLSQREREQEAIRHHTLVNYWLSLLEVQHSCHILIDLLGTAIRDGCRLHRRHERVPAQGWARGVELLVGCLVMLVGVHLREIIATGDLTQRRNQGFRNVSTIGILLGRGLFDLVSAAYRARVHVDV